MSCKCCAGPCRKKRVKRKGGAKKPKAQKQPQVSITLAPPMLSKMPGLAPTFQSSVQTPLSEQRLATGTRRIAREIETQTEPSTRSEIRTQTVQLAGRHGAEELARYSRERLPDETMSDYRIRTYQTYE